MKITKEDYHLPYILCKKKALIPVLSWQVWPIFGIIWSEKKWKKISEYGIVICGLQISVVHEWW
jgi:hypothetical protein